MLRGWEGRGFVQPGKGRSGSSCCLPLQQAIIAPLSLVKGCEEESEPQQGGNSAEHKEESFHNRDGCAMEQGWSDCARP